MNAKYVQFALLLFLCVGLDQWSKQLASSRLAAAHSWIDHPVVLTVGLDQGGTTVREFLAREFTSNEPDEVREIARRYTFDAEGERLSPDTELAAGDRVEVRRRKITVIPRVFDLEYTRNPGAAFGLFSEADSPWRVPFFIVVSLIAIGVIVMMLRGVDKRDQLTIFALSFIAGGAIGNFIDRLSYGWVIDFIVWKYTEEYRWPTFNIADAFISVGVALLVVGMLRDWWQERSHAIRAAGEEA